MTAIAEPPPNTEQPAKGPASPDSSGRVAIFKHSRASRWMHWINFPLLTIMIWSGLRIYWSDVRDPFGVGVGAWHWFDLLPDYVNEKLGLERRLARGLAFHFAFGWLFTINGVAYGLHLWRSKEWKHIAPERTSLKDSAQVMLYDATFGKFGRLPPQGRYNAAQRVSYSLIIFLGALVVLTGLAIYKPTQLSFLTASFGGYENARAIHFFTTMGFLLFFVVHIMQVLRAGWGNFASMVTGYELESKKEWQARIAMSRAEDAMEAELAEQANASTEEVSNNG